MFQHIMSLTREFANLSMDISKRNRSASDTGASKKKDQYSTFNVKLDGKNNYSVTYKGYYYTVDIEDTTYIASITWGRGTILGMYRNGVAEKLTDEHRYKMKSLGIDYR